VPEPAYLAYRDGDCAFVADARDFPLLVTTWWGEASVPLVRRFFAWNDAMCTRAMSEDTHVAMVSDNRHSKRPPATVRKLLAELTDASTEIAGGRALPTLVVIDNALVRGALTAIQWLSARSWGVQVVASVEDGLRQALDALAAAGAEPPDVDPSAHVAPAMPEVDGESALSA
jgi:hypothetical protein